MDRSTDMTRRDLLKAAGVAAAGLSGGRPRRPGDGESPDAEARRHPPARAISDPVTGFDPHQTISFLTMIPLSFAYSRLVKVKAGPSVKPMTYPIEPDLAESWTQPDDKTYVFKLKKGVRWHPKPPVNGRELTADDVKYTYERFLTIAGNGNKPVLESIDKIDVLDKHTVKFTLKEPNAWFLDMLASTSTWIIAKECVEKFGDLKKAESVVGTGPWMLERWEPNVRLVYVRNPNYFVPGLPYADGVEVVIDKDPSSRLATCLAGKLDFGPEYQQVVRRLDLATAKQRKPGLQTRRVHVVHQRRHRLQDRQAAVQRRPRPAGALPRRQHGRDLRVERVLPGPLDPQPRRPRRRRGVVDPHRSARPRGPEALRALDRGGQAPAGRGRPSERVQDAGGGAGHRLRPRLHGRRADPASRTGRRPGSTPS